MFIKCIMVLAMWIVIGIGALMAIVRIQKHLGVRFLHKVMCPRCGYPMTGLQTSICPECGSETHYTVKPREPSRAQFRVLVVLLALIWSLCCIGGWYQAVRALAIANNVWVPYWQPSMYRWVGLSGIVAVGIWAAGIAGAWMCSKSSP